MFIITTAHQKQFIAIDQASGGYPCLSTYLGSAKFFTRREEAIEYGEGTPQVYVPDLFIGEITITNGVGLKKAVSEKAAIRARAITKLTAEELIELGVKP